MENRDQFPDEHGHKNAQKTIWKENSTAHCHDHTPCLSWFHSREANMVQYMQNNKYNAVFK
jgi:hypothetical protein